MPRGPVAFAGNPQAVLPGDNNIATGAGFWLTSLYAFAIFSLLTEVFLNVLGVKPYVTMVAGPLAMVMLVMSGRFGVAYSATKIGIFATLYALWMFCTIPMAYYKAGSLEISWFYLTRIFPLMLLIPAMVTNRVRLRTFLQLMGWGGVILAMVSLKFGGIGEDGRFVVPNTTLGNPNDMATHMLFLMPFCGFMVISGGGFGINRIAGLFGVLGMLAAVMRSGSRGAMLAAGAVGVLLFWRAKPAQKLVVVVLGILLAATTVVVLPDTLLSRYKTFFSRENSELESKDYAVGSTSSRMYVLQKSLEYTVRNPLFGLGPGNFVNAEASEAGRKGTRGSWIGTHNTYTEVSSEMGLVGLLFYVGILLGILRSVFWVQKATVRIPRLQALHQMSMVLLASFGLYAFATIFSHLSYRYYMPFLAGLAVAMVVVTRQELLAIESEGKAKLVVSAAPKNFMTMGKRVEEVPVMANLEPARPLRLRDAGRLVAPRLSTEG